MARNSMAKMVNKASDVDGAVSEKNGVEVVGGVVEVASRIGGAVGTGGTDSVGSSSTAQPVVALEILAWPMLL